MSINRKLIFTNILDHSTKVPTEIEGQSQRSGEAEKQSEYEKLFCFHRHGFKKMKKISPSFLPQNTLETLSRDPIGFVEDSQRSEVAAILHTY